MRTVLGDRNSSVVQARRLTRRAHRDRVREFLAEGPRAIREAVATPGVVLEVFGTPSALDQHGDWLAEAPVKLQPISDKAAAALSETVHPQGLIARCRYVDVDLAAALPGLPRLVAVLAGISDPGNAGAIMRTADAAGADAVIFTEGSVDPYNGKCVRASAGSLFHLPIVRSVAHSEVPGALASAGLQVFGAAASASRRLGDPETDALLQAPTAWVFGSEAHGLPRIESGNSLVVDEQIGIPIWGLAESLNLAAAASICLFASATVQRRASSVTRLDSTGCEGAGNR